MNRAWVRIVALVLVGCLAADPATSVQSPRSNACLPDRQVQGRVALDLGPETLDCFSEQALAVPSRQTPGAPGTARQFRQEAALARPSAGDRDVNVTEPSALAEAIANAIDSNRAHKMIGHLTAQIQALREARIQAGELMDVETIEGFVSGIPLLRKRGTVAATAALLRKKGFHALEPSRVSQQSSRPRVGTLLPIEIARQLALSPQARILSFDDHPPRLSAADLPDVIYLPKPAELWLVSSADDALQTMRRIREYVLGGATVVYSTAAAPFGQIASFMRQRLPPEADVIDVSIAEDPRVEYHIARLPPGMPTVPVSAGRRRAETQFRQVWMGLLEESNPGLMARIEKVLTTSFERLVEGEDYDQRSMGRSLILRLEHPVEIRGQTIEAIKIKGVVFEAGRPDQIFNLAAHRIHLGIDPPLPRGQDLPDLNEGFIDSEGYYRQRPFYAERLGGMRFERAYREYVTTSIGVSYDLNMGLPLGVVRFPDETTIGRAPLGAVILGIPNETDFRTSDLIGILAADPQYVGAIREKLLGNSTERFQEFREVVEDIVGFHGEALFHLNSRRLIHTQFHLSNSTVTHDVRYYHDGDSLLSAADELMTPAQFFGYLLDGLECGIKAMHETMTRHPCYSVLGMDWVGAFLRGYFGDIPLVREVGRASMKDLLQRGSSTPFYALTDHPLVRLVWRIVRQTENPTAADLEWIRQARSLEEMALAVPSRQVPGRFAALSTARQFFLTFRQTQASKPSLWENWEASQMRMLLHGLVMPIFSMAALLTSGAAQGQTSVRREILQDVRNAWPPHFTSPQWIGIGAVLAFILYYFVIRPYLPERAVKEKESKSPEKRRLTDEERVRIGAQMRAQGSGPPRLVPVPEPARPSAGKPEDLVPTLPNFEGGRESLRAAA